ncbi:MAG: fatty acid cis/trans isomerase [Nitrospinota bacterium]|nr:fatty acid cis/trans isomerase [Nitrospinota bacterium]
MKGLVRLFSIILSFGGAASVFAQTASTIDSLDVYTSQIKPIFDSRCVVCHACIEAPCNLLLTSHEGVIRGGHNYDVFGSNVFAIPKQRLGTDATSEAQWRERGFHPVVDKSRGVTAGERVENSLLLRFVQLAAANNTPDNINRVEAPKNKSCPRNVEEFDDLFRRNDKDIFEWLSPSTQAHKDKLERSRALGMPFGLLPLTSNQITTLTEWVKSGAPGPTEATINGRLTAKNRRFVEAAESFLNAGHEIENGDKELDRKRLWTAKYLYEHLYTAHLFQEDNPGEYFMVVRSETRDGPIKKIVTDYPYDDPKKNFWYRLERYDETVVVKSHSGYALSEEKLNRVNDLFINRPWTGEKGQGGIGIPEVNWDDNNPFINFAVIPARARYQWMLENAFLMMNMFSKGDACIGGVSTYSIRDHSWVMFIDPDSDISLTMPGYFNLKSGSSGKFGDKTIAELLMIPALDPTQYKVPGYFKERLYEYEKFHARLLQKELPEGYSEEDIWNGEITGRDGQTITSPNALMTLYRHKLSVTIHQGHMGSTPKTGLVIDYPSFERLYYDIVGTFDIYGSAARKIHARIYMERLRREAEDKFLAFLPKRMRSPVRKSWYKRDYQMPEFKPLFVKDLETRVPVVYPKDPPEILGYRRLEYLGEGGPENAAKQFLRRMSEIVLSKGAAGYPDDINDHHFKNTTFAGELPEKYKKSLSNDSREWRKFASFFTRLADRKKPFVRLFPDVSYITITQDENADPIFLTVVANKSHKSMNVLFGENQTRDPENDTLHIVKDLVMARPNQFFEFPLEETPEFIRQAERMETDEDYNRLLQMYGIFKSSGRFWPYLDRLTNHIMKTHPVYGGRLDLNEYGAFSAY